MSRILYAIHHRELILRSFDSFWITPHEYVPNSLVVGAVSRYTLRAEIYWEPLNLYSTKFWINFLISKGLKTIKIPKILDEPNLTENKFWKNFFFDQGPQEYPGQEEYVLGFAMLDGTRINH